jgi:hypothetical protein
MAMGNRIALSLVPGICSPLTDTSWVDKAHAAFAHWEPRWIIKPHEYPCSGLTSLPLVGRMYTVYWRDRRVAKGLVNELLPFMQKTRPKLWFAAHSNGCIITRLAVQMLVQKGFHVEGVILMGAACTPEVDELQDFVLSKSLGKAVAFCSSEDYVLRNPWKWPFKGLGCTGWQMAGSRFESSKIYNLWYQKYGHSDYFAEGNLNKTLRQIQKEIKT